MSHERARLTLPVSARDHIDGPDDAVVTLVQYGDYQCPHCARAHPIVKAIQERLGSRLQFAFRNFALTEIHPHAQHAAEAAEAAAAQGHFQEMHHALFEHQQALADRDLMQYAAEIGLDRARFQGELVNHTHAPRIREDFLSGVRSGVNRTPTFFINGFRHDGSWDFQTLMEALAAFNAYEEAS